MMEHPNSHSITHRQNKNSFPAKLHRILANPEFSAIISWLPHGRSWRIVKRDEFEQRILPRYFRHNNLASFMRQVNGWGFLRMTRGLDRNSYYHEKFLRGKSILCKQMQRPSSENVRLLRSASIDKPEPNFYEMSKKNPLPEEKFEALLETSVDRKMSSIYQDYGNFQHNLCSKIHKVTHSCGDLQPNGVLYPQPSYLSLPNAQSLSDHSTLTSVASHDLQQAENVLRYDYTKDLFGHFE